MLYMFTFILALLAPLSLFCQSLPPNSYTIESNIFTQGQRWIKLNDGSYWELSNSVIHRLSIGSRNPLSPYDDY